MSPALRSGARAAAFGLCAGVLLSPPSRPQEPKKHAMRAPLPSADEIKTLPPDGGPLYNRLVFEQSPYLLQHAANPVDWFPWGSEAFARAASEDKPVFLSIGYSTCHWCHVMERESFEDAEVAALLNEHFVCVKVDREERPDLDQVYMSVTQALTGSGGWPMTVVLTPDKKPFFAGTYFPKRGRLGRGGMVELVPALSRAWKQNREQVLESAEQITAALARSSAGAGAGELDSAVLERAERELASRFDPGYGGFGEAPKFPTPHNLCFLLRRWRRSGDAGVLLIVETTLRAMRTGGIWDHVGFGFHRYSTDRIWLLPHFEKMLYDQALLAIAYAEAYQATGKGEYRRTAEEILAYVARDMSSPEGAFYSAEDADSEGEEGLFYTWTPEELEAVLGPDDGKLAAEVYGVEKGGNFADQSTGGFTGRSILHLPRGLDELAKSRGTGAGELERRLESIRARLFAAREARVHPLKDDKVLTDWNGLMIAAFSRCARAFGEPKHERAAARAADFLLERLRGKDGRLFKRWRGGRAALPGMLEDYAFATFGLIELYQAGFDARYLAAALELQRAALEHFWDRETAGFFLSPDDGEALIVRAKEVYDGAIPSGNAVAIGNLLRLARITGESELEERAAQALQVFSGDVARLPQAHTWLLGELDFALGPSFEVVVAGRRGAADTEAMLEALQRAFAPNAVLLFRPEGLPEPAIAVLAPFTAGQRALGGKATAYVCTGGTCKAPTTDPAAALAALGSDR
jgi:hypothetical protein